MKIGLHRTGRPILAWVLAATVGLWRISLPAESAAQGQRQGQGHAEQLAQPPKDADQVRSLAKAVREADEHSKPFLIDVLGNVSPGATHLQDAYRALLDDKDSGVQDAAIKAAARLKMKDAAPKIRRLLSQRKRYHLSNDHDIYKYGRSADIAERNYELDAIRALIDLDDFDSIDEIMTHDEFMSEMPGAALAKFGPRVLQKVISNAGNGWAQHVGAKSTISRMTDEAAVPTLLNILNGTDQEFAISAEDALSQIGEKTASDTTRKLVANQLEAHFSDKNERMRIFAYRGLLNMDPGVYGSRILKAFDKENEVVQGYVLDSIALHPPKGIDLFLEQFIRDDERRHPGAYDDQRARAARIIFKATGRKVIYKGLEGELKKGKDPYVE